MKTRKILAIIVLVLAGFDQAATIADLIPSGSSDHASMTKVKSVSAIISLSSCLLSRNTELT